MLLVRTALFLAALAGAGNAMSAISYVASTSASANGTTISVGKPIGVVQGDVMLAVVSQRGTAFPVDQQMVGTPTGWTAVVAKDNASSLGMAIYVRTASSSEPATYAWTLGGSDRTEVGIVAFRGVDPTLPVLASGAQLNAASTTYTAPSVSTTVNNAVLAAFYAAPNGNGSINAASGMTLALSAGNAAGPNGVVVGSSYAAQGSTGASGIRVTTSNIALINIGALVALRPSPSVLDHYEISLPTAGVACAPTAVTITACGDSSSPCTAGYAASSGSTAQLTSSSGATLATTTVTFDTTGVARTTLNAPGAGNGTLATVTLSGEQLAAARARQCCPDGSSCTAAASCSTTFNSAGFLIADTPGGPATVLPPRTAGAASASYVLRAVQSGTTAGVCTAALTGRTSVGWGYRCSDPDRCSASNLLTLDADTPTVIQRNDSSATALVTSLSMVFDANGNAPFRFAFNDVGRISLLATKALNGAVLSGTSNGFVSKPADLVIGEAKQTAAPARPNPVAGSASGAVFVKAGEPFSLTVTATTTSGAAAPNFGHEAVAQGVVLGPTLVAPAGGSTGTLSNAVVAGAAFGNGAARPSDLAWDEVGILSLRASLAGGDYLGAGNVTGTPSENIGRFIPDHFDLTAGTTAPGCSGTFTYFGQDGFATPFVLKAQNTANGTTRNYTGSFAALDLSNWSSFIFTAPGLPAGASLSSGATAPSGGWSLGVASVLARHQVSRPAPPVGEVSVIVKARPVDFDGVTLPAAVATGGSSPLRYGRLRLSNAFGSEKAGLRMPVQAEYWSGNSWVPNAADSCTVVPSASITRAAYLDGRGAPTAAWSTTASAVSMVGGSGSLALSAPTPTATGSVDIALNLGTTAADQSCLATHPASTGADLAHLRSQQGSCSSGWNRDPAGRATFGVYVPESRRTLHVREVF